VGKRSEWQFCFTVNGLVAPKEGMRFDDDLLFVGTKKRDDVSDVFFRIQACESNLHNSENTSLQRLWLLLCIYGLCSGRYAEMPDSCGYTTIDADQPFGKPKLRGYGDVFLAVREEQWDRFKSILKMSVIKFYELEGKLVQKEKRFLRNAIDYYYRSLKHTVLEETLIDLIVALESLLSRENHELGLRLSQRACLLVGETDEERKQILSLVKKLYRKRSQIVHSGETKNLSAEDVERLRRYVKEAIIRLVHIDMSKEDIIELMDLSCIDGRKRAELVKLSKNAKEKWNDSKALMPTA
jgi:hypothetical protein